MEPILLPPRDAVGVQSLSGLTRGSIGVDCRVKPGNDGVTVRATPLPDDRADTPSDFAPCARCGRWSKLIPCRTGKDAVLWLQPVHFCVDGLLRGLV